MRKIHFLFTMLSVNILYVVETGRVLGIITKDEFLRKKQSLTHLVPQRAEEDFSPKRYAHPSEVEMHTLKNH